MDGLLHSLDPEVPVWYQQTLKAPIGCVGVGLHTGRRVSLTFGRPRRTMASCSAAPISARTIPARFDRVVDTRLSTVLAHGDARIGTVEHVMAALGRLRHR